MKHPHLKGGGFHVLLFLRPSHVCIALPQCLLLSLSLSLLLNIMMPQSGPPNDVLGVSMSWLGSHYISFMSRSIAPTFLHVVADPSTTDRNSTIPSTIFDWQWTT